MSVSGRNCIASESAAADSTDGDDKEKIKAEAEADLLENVFIYLTEGRYQEEMSANQKRVIRKKAANFEIENGEMIFKKKCRGKDEVSLCISQQFL